MRSSCSQASLDLTLPQSVATTITPSEHTQYLIREMGFIMTQEAVRTTKHMSYPNMSHSNSLMYKPRLGKVLTNAAYYIEPVPFPLSLPPALQQHFQPA